MSKGTLDPLALDQREQHLGIGMATPNTAAALVQHAAQVGEIVYLTVEGDNIAA